MIKVFKALLMVGFCYLLTVGMAGAESIDSPSDIDSPKTVITFESYAFGTPTPITEAGATISGGEVTNAYGPNNQYVSGKYLGYGGISFYIAFSQPVSQFGLGVFDPNFQNQLIAYDADDNQLESIVLPANLTVVTSIFAGFKRTQADIAEIHLINSTGRDAIGIDNITFSRVTATPIPGAVWLLGSGLVGLIGMARRRLH